jgi:hypothetical protein
MAAWAGQAQGDGEAGTDERTRTIGDRQREVEAYLAEQRSKYHLVEIQTWPNGDLVDWVDAADFPGSQGPTPPPPTFAGAKGNEKTPSTVLERRPDLRVQGAIPLIRPSFDRYIRGSSDAATPEEYVRSMPPGAPAGNERLYASYTLAQSGTTGVDSSLNGGWTSVDLPGTNQMVLHEMTVFDPGCGPTTHELVGVALGYNESSSNYRMWVEFATEGENVGPLKGGWHSSSVTGFQPQMGATINSGDAFSPLSAVGGTQYAVRLTVQRDSLCHISGCTGGWWIWVNNQWIGHYPIGTGTDLVPFDLIDTSAPEGRWYGEVWDQSEGVWTSADMGSGNKPSGTPSSDYGSVAYFRSIGARTTGGFLVVPAGSLSSSGGDDPDCYSGTVSSNSPYSWMGTTVWLGGPGKVGSTCDPY